MAQEPPDTLESPASGIENQEPFAAERATNGLQPASDHQDSDADLLDWTSIIESPPPRKMAVLTVHFVDGGRRPVPADLHFED